MGIDMGSSLFIGLPAKEFDEDFIDDCQMNDTLSRISPTYDCGNDEAYLGVHIYTACESADKIKIDFQKIQIAIQSAIDDFKEITGKDGNLYISSDVN